MFSVPSKIRYIYSTMAPSILLTILVLFTSALANQSISTTSLLVQSACKATRYTSICVATLSQVKALPANPTAIDFIRATMGLCETDLKMAEEKAQSILEASKGKDPNMTTAAESCLSFLGLSEKRLTMAEKAVGKGGFADARAWGSAALLYQYGCWSALKYVNTTNQVADAMSFILHITNVTSNSISMITSLQRYGKDFSLWSPPQTERDDYWEDEVLSHPGDSSDIRTQNSVPSNLKPNAYVCANSSCSYQTVQAAVDAAPAWSSKQYIIYIKQGVYMENVRVPFEKTNLVFLGDGMGKTIITANLTADSLAVSPYNSSTVGVRGDGFMARDLTISNTARSPVGNKSLAFMSDSDHSIIESVEFLGHQDTLYAHALRQLYKSCRISGTVDFIFGNSATIFQDCMIFFLPRQVNPEKGESNVVAAQGRTDPAQSTGFVFNNCTVNGSVEYWNYYNKNTTVHKAFLGRPWKEYSRTVFINCSLEKMVSPEGWLPWKGDFALGTLYYGEYRSKGPGANVEQRVPWSSQIPKEHLDVYSMRSFIQTAYRVGGFGSMLVVAFRACSAGCLCEGMHVVPCVWSMFYWVFCLLGWWFWFRLLACYVGRVLFLSGCRAMLSGFFVLCWVVRMCLFGLVLWRVVLG